MIVTIDGPAGAGKSTIAKLLAKKNELIHINTGTMYRAIGYHLIQKNIASDDIDTINEEMKNITMDIKLENGEQVMVLNGSDITADLRTEEISNYTSAIATINDVREKTTKVQREVAVGKNIVMEGRDIGSVVFPNAEYKIYLTASSSERAKRRFEELQDSGISLETIEKDIIARDEADMNREISPLTIPQNAIEIDSSNLTIQEVVDKIGTYIK